MAVRGEITAGDFTAFILYLQRMIWYLIALGYVVNLYQRGTASLKRFNAILEAEPRLRTTRLIEQPPIKGTIEFRDLTFAYNGKPVLKDIDLTIEQGKTVAFVGKTGSGKSTLVSLIPRLLDAPDGSVLIDGRPVREYPLAQLRRADRLCPAGNIFVQRHAGRQYRLRRRRFRLPSLRIRGTADRICERGDVGAVAAASADGGGSLIPRQSKKPQSRRPRRRRRATSPANTNSLSANAASRSRADKNSARRSPVR